jgi:hypothetical protein
MARPMKNLLFKLIHQIGHRGGFLLFLTVIDIAYGWTFYNSAKLGFDLFLPIHDWAYVWFATGIVTFIGAFLRKGDRYPFGIATTVKVCFAFEWFNLALHNPHAIPYAWLTGVIWTVFAMTTFLISTWPERSRIRKIDPPILDIGERDME